jgi:hypothetical protein
MKARTFAVISIGLITMCFGVGCKKKAVIFTPAPETKPVEVPKNVEGAQASTGGYDTTVTPSLAPSLLAAALPPDDALEGFGASTPVEEKNPVPLPDGTRAEYSTLKKSYVKENASISVTITDTKSLPVLTAFIQSYQPYENTSGARWETVIDDATGWITTSKSPDTEETIAASFLMLYRGRFIIQMSGNLGVTAENLLTLARALDLKQLR